MYRVRAPKKSHCPPKRKSSRGDEPCVARVPRGADPDEPHGAYPARPQITLYEHTVNKILVPVSLFNRVTNVTSFPNKRIYAL